MRLDHVNLRTTRLDEMVAWYRDVIGMEEGWRPPFDFPGAWMYSGERALVHLIGVDAEPGSNPADLKLEHFAFSIDDPKGLSARMAAAGVHGFERAVPGTDIVQINLHDPDGNHLHIDYRKSTEL
ncbi:MAG: VOC family protein [Pseudomonadota bacterium]